MLKVRLLPINVQSLNVSNSMVFGCIESVSSLLNTTSVLTKAATMALPVPCPVPAQTSEPYSVTLN